jgi:Ran GTPase-activating protein (RanGAP) involved in mRNA processing and transport
VHLHVCGVIFAKGLNSTTVKMERKTKLTQALLSVGFAGHLVHGGDPIPGLTFQIVAASGCRDMIDVSPAEVAAFLCSNVPLGAARIATSCLGGGQSNVPELCRVIAAEAPYLRRLELSLTVAAHAQDTANATALVAQLPQLRDLTLSGFEFDCLRASALSDALQKPRELRVLKLVFAGLDAEAAEALAGIGALARLDVICVARNALGDAGCHALSAALGRLRRLRQIDVSGCSIGERGADALAAAVAQHPRLTALRLDENPDMTMAGVDAVLSAACTAPLRVLNVSDTGMTGHGLATLVAHWPKLEELNVSNNDIGPQGAAALLQVAGNSGQMLRHLNISGVRLEVEGAAALAEALPRLPCLEELEMRGNRVRDADWQHIATALIALMRLRVLDVSGNLMGPPGAHALAGVIASLPRLELLDVSRNEVQAEGLAALAAAVRGNAVIESIDVSYNRVGNSAAGVAALLTLLSSQLQPRCCVAAEYNHFSAAEEKQLLFAADAACVLLQL